MGGLVGEGHSKTPELVLAWGTRSVCQSVCRSACFLVGTSEFRGIGAKYQREASAHEIHSLARHPAYSKQPFLITSHRIPSAFHLTGQVYRYGYRYTHAFTIRLALSCLGLNLIPVVVP